MNDWEFKIAKLELEPGDILVVKTDNEPWYDIIHHLVPAGVRVLYIPNDMELSILTRAEIEAKAA